MNLDTLLTQPGRRYYKLNTALMYIWICRLIRTLRRCVWTLFHSKRDEFQKPAHSFPNGPVRCDNVRLQQLSPYLVYFPSRQHVRNKKDFLQCEDRGVQWVHMGPCLYLRSRFFSWKLMYGIWQPADWGVAARSWRVHHSEAVETKAQPKLHTKGKWDNACLLNDLSLHLCIVNRDAFGRKNIMDAQYSANSPWFLRRALNTDPYSLNFMTVTAQWRTTQWNAQNAVQGLTTVTDQIKSLFENIFTLIIYLEYMYICIHKELGSKMR